MLQIERVIVFLSNGGICMLYCDPFITFETTVMFPFLLYPVPIPATHVLPATIST